MGQSSSQLENPTQHPAQHQLSANDDDFDLHQELRPTSDVREDPRQELQAAVAASVDELQRKKKNRKGRKMKKLKAEQASKQLDTDVDENGELAAFKKTVTGVRDEDAHMGDETDSLQLKMSEITSTRKSRKHIERESAGKQLRQEEEHYLGEIRPGQVLGEDDVPEEKRRKRRKRAFSSLDVSGREEEYEEATAPVEKVCKKQKKRRKTYRQDGEAGIPQSAEQDQEDVGKSQLRTRGASPQVVVEHPTQKESDEADQTVDFDLAVEKPQAHSHEPGLGTQEIENDIVSLEHASKKCKRQENDRPTAGPDSASAAKNSAARNASGPFTQQEQEIVRRVFFQVLKESGLSNQEFVNQLQDWRHADLFKTAIYAALPNRSKDSIRKHCKQRFHLLESGPWTSEQDDRLRDAYIKWPNQWTKIGHLVGRIGCKERWRLHLQYEGKETGPWHENDEQLLLESVEECIANIKKEMIEVARDHTRAQFEAMLNWAVIAEKFDGRRSTKQCREKYPKLKKRQTREEQAELTEADQAGITNRADFAKTDMRKARTRIDEARKQLKDFEIGDYYDVLRETYLTLNSYDVKFHDDHMTVWSAVAAEFRDSRFNCTYLGGALRRAAYESALFTWVKPKEIQQKINRLVGVGARARVLADWIMARSNNETGSLARTYQPELIKKSKPELRRIIKQRRELYMQRRAEAKATAEEKAALSKESVEDSDAEPEPQADDAQTSKHVQSEEAKFQGEHGNPDSGDINDGHTKADQRDFTRELDRDSTSKEADVDGEESEAPENEDLAEPQSDVEQDESEGSEAEDGETQSDNIGGHTSVSEEEAEPVRVKDEPIFDVEDYNAVEDADTSQNGGSGHSDVEDSTSKEDAQDDDSEDAVDHSEAQIHQALVESDLEEEEGLAGFQSEVTQQFNDLINSESEDSDEDELAGAKPEVLQSTNETGNQDDEDSSSNEWESSMEVEGAQEIEETDLENSQATPVREQDEDTDDEIPVSSVNSRQDQVSPVDDTLRMSPDSFTQRCQSAGRRQHIQYTRKNMNRNRDART